MYHAWPHTACSGPHAWRTSHTCGFVQRLGPYLTRMTAPASVVGLPMVLTMVLTMPMVLTPCVLWSTRGPFTLVPGVADATRPHHA